jgi:electron transport complex protein RnfA
MNTASPFQVFIDAALINNFVLAMFLFVMLVSSMAAFGIHKALVVINAPYLQLISYIVVIASAVQLVEMFLKKFSPTLFRALGIFLPLITTNCAILGVALFQTNREYNFLQSLFFALGAGAGFTLALLLMAGLRERLELSDVSSVVKGAALTLMVAGVLSIAFTGFAGMGR